MTHPRRDPLDRALTRLGFSVQFVYTALAVATGVLVVFVAGAGWNALRWVRRGVRRRHHLT